MLTMIDRGIRHVPVVSGSGELLGVATDVDLLAAETRTPIMLRRTIADATDVETLRETAAQVNSTLIAMHEAGVAATRISEILSVIVDALVRRVIELTIASVGPPPAELGWLSLGSFGRREAVPSSDVDSGMVWADDPDADVAATCGTSAARDRRARRDGLAAGRARRLGHGRDVGELDGRVARRDRRLDGGSRPGAGPGGDLDRARRPHDLRARARPRRAGAAPRGPPAPGRCCA